MNLKVVGAAAVLLTTIAPLAAHADEDNKAFTLKLGAFQPGNGHTQNRFGNTWFTAGGDVVVKNTAIGSAAGAVSSAAEPLVYLDYTGSEAHNNGETEKVSNIGVGVGVRYYGTYQVTSDYRPYLGAGVGAYFLHGQVADSTGAESSKDQVNAGFKVNAGVEYLKTYVLDVAYSAPGEVKGVSQNGLAVTLGVRF